jgi:hypothetical protein
MPDMMQPDIVPGMQPGSVWKGTDQQRTGEEKKQLVGRLMQSTDITPRERLAIEYEQATGKNPPAGVFEPKPSSPGQLVQNDKGEYVRVDNENGVTPVGVKGYHAPQQPIVIQTGEGPQLLNRGTGTAKPIKGGTGEVIGAKEPAQIATQKANAGNVRAHIADIAQQADQIDKMGLMGPVGGRWAAFLAGKVGSADLVADPAQQELLNEFRTNVGLLKSGMAMVHGGARGGGSPAIMGRMDALINADSMNMPLFKGSLKAFDKWLAQYQGETKKDGTTEGKPTAEDLIKKYGGGGD